MNEWVTFAKMNKQLLRDLMVNSEIIKKKVLQN